MTFGVMRNNVNVTPSSCNGEYSAACGSFFIAVGHPALASASSRYSRQSWRRVRRTPRRPRLARSAASTTGDTFIAADHALSGKNGPGTQKCFATESETAKAARAVARRRFRAQVGFRRQTYQWMRWSYNASAFVLLTIRSILRCGDLRWALNCSRKSISYQRNPGEERRYGARLSSQTGRHMEPISTIWRTAGRGWNGSCHGCATPSGTMANMPPNVRHRNRTANLRIHRRQSNNQSPRSRPGCRPTKHCARTGTASSKTPGKPVSHHSTPRATSTSSRASGD